jgi:hypothetical protein
MLGIIIAGVAGFILGAWMWPVIASDLRADRRSEVIRLRQHAVKKANR